MSKKEFKSGLDILLQGSESIPNEKKVPIISANTKEVRATFIVQETQLNEMKAIAYWHRKQIKLVLKEAISLYISSIPKEILEEAILEFRKLESR